MPAKLPFLKSNRSQASVGSSTEHSSTVSLDRQEAVSNRYQLQEEQHNRPFVQSFPGQSPTQRYSNNVSLDRPPVNVAASVNAGETSLSNDRPPDSRYYTTSSSSGPPRPQPPEQKKSFRTRLGNVIGHTHRESGDRVQPAVDNKTGVGRSVSNRTYPQGWPSQQESRQYLAPSTEHNEASGLDPFLVQTEQQSPVPPPKDPIYSERYDQNQSSRPSLARVNTNPDYLYQSSPHHSPEQNSGGTRHSLQKQNQSPHTSIQQQEDQLQYQAFGSQQAPNQSTGGAPQTQQYQQQDDELHLHQQRQQAFEQYHQQQQVHRQLQHGGPDSQQPQSQDDFQGRPPSQQQQYPYHQGKYHPQGPQGPPPPPHQDTQYLQSLRPPSQQQQYPASSPGRIIGGPPSRQGSDGLEQPQPGQGHGQPPTLGLASFSANVVPPTSQGQPYKSSPQQDGEMSRSTPPPGRGPSDMTEDDIVQLQKEYKELKDKYQKVKKYYFEKESQVHTLQNTLAHQRLSLSRTSLDDNEYCNRFNRLDGLISQLAFSIRKSWKTIPHWLAPAVNKDAISVGKQEMTAVGRAFISAWLVSDLFDKYFHPDLEPGFSSQLKAIQLAIRRSGAANAQLSGAEEEEQLTARIINWRLTTIEGLADQLRAAQAQQNRHQLVTNLHEKMKAALEMHLVDPAPRISTAAST
ncbi:hypothetical protein H2199_006994 [Coniosporium tulheliwenetii]|uniref:Uncharacterized protein n=1 Tax=Coniosporium tulheliwenetii TaxID=3383036 RepID=A0ACC2YSE9_9PEZI|nr:hypothetical protein H2199_006994 [Cladosporium sp. JES 115]